MRDINMSRIYFRVKMKYEDEWYIFPIFYSESCACDLENAIKDTLEISFDNCMVWNKVDDISNIIELKGQ